jgi:hypothetical protein
MHRTEQEQEHGAWFVVSQRHNNGVIQREPVDKGILARVARWENDHRSFCTVNL